MTDNSQRTDTIEIIERARTFYLPREKDMGFAIRCGISQTAYSGYTLGRGAIHIDNIIKIANTTGASLQWLITGEGPRLKQDVVGLTAIATDHSAVSVSQSGSSVATNTTSNGTYDHHQVVTYEGFHPRILAMLIQDRELLSKCAEQLCSLLTILGRQPLSSQ